MNLKDLVKSFEDMTTDELQQTIMRIRAERREVPPETRKKAASDAQKTRKRKESQSLERLRLLATQMGLTQGETQDDAESDPDTE